MGSKEAALDYIRANKTEKNTWSNIRTCLANNNKVREIKEKRSRVERTSNDFLKSYDDITTRALKELEAEEKIVISITENRKRYILADDKPTVRNLYNRDIAVFEVTDGDVQLAVKIIEANKTNKNLVVIPVGQFLLCTIRNSRKDDDQEKQPDSQLKEIRKLVNIALKKSESKVTAKL